MNIYKKRINDLRTLMREQNIDYYMILTDDFHSSEYVGDFFKCREYMSGFTGSAGTLLVGLDWAGLWTDGRYFIQAADELEGSDIELMKSGTADVPSIHNFLASHMETDSILAYDGRTVNYALTETIRSTFLKMHGSELKTLTDIDLVGELWDNRPAFPHAEIWELDVKYAGKSRREKLNNLRENLEHPLLISSLADIAWLYNIRGKDILYTPVAMAYTLIDKERAILYLAKDAVPDSLSAALAKDGIELRAYEQVYSDIASEFTGSDAPALQMDKASVNEALAGSVTNPVFRTNPTSLSKAVKNAVEIKNERTAHLKDGIAMTKAICWLKSCACSISHDGKVYSDESKPLTELEVSAKIRALREQQDDFIDLSFESIVAMGPHGAIIHYDPTPQTDKELERGLLLMDTGGHYLQGTTDITRTIVLGEATEDEKSAYTAVLRGNLALGAAIYPEGTTGNSLDVLARNPLWEMGFDYNHGTGHGVGYLLSVHEGPNAIRPARSEMTNGTPLEEGMITSNEPGVYIEGRFGVRLENLVLSRKMPGDFDSATFMEFETLTLVPFDRDAIEVDMLSPMEISLLDDYHSRVYDALKPFMNKNELAWLAEATAPLKINDSCSLK